MKKSKPADGCELHVLIKEAKNLTATKAGGTCDSFVKGYANICFIISTKVFKSLCLCISIKASANNSIPQVSAAIKEQVFLQEENSSGEKDKEPKLQPHICVQQPESGAAEGHVSGAHCLGQRDPVQQ